MNMYAKAAVLTLVLTLIIALAHLALSRRRPLPPRRRWRLGEVLVYLGFIASTAVLGASAICAMVQHGVMHGWFLWLHLSAAGAFVVLLAIMALMWAEASRFRPNATEIERRMPQRFTTFAKAMYWAVVLTGALSIATILVNMWSFLGTQGQVRTIAVHRYLGLVLVAVAVLHLYAVSLGRLGRR